MSNFSNRPILIVVEDNGDNVRTLMDCCAKAHLEAEFHESPDAAIAAINRLWKTEELVGVITDLHMQGKVEAGWAVVRHTYSLSRSLDLAVWTGFKEQTFPLKAGEDMPAFKFFVKDDSAPVLRWMQDVRARWERGIGLTLQDPDTRSVYLELAPLYAKSSLPVLILGETGTGKESLAQTIHNSSERQSRLVAVNAGGLEPSLAFSELFGHTRGAFTDAHFHEIGKILEASGYAMGPQDDSRAASLPFLEWLQAANPDMKEVPGRPRLLHSEQARRRAGTLFLDEIAGLPPKVMTGLLRVLETGDVTPFGYHGVAIASYCRIVTATNEVDAFGSGGGFRADLLFRLAGVILTLKPLRERDRSDIENYISETVWHSISLPRMPVEAAALNRICDLYLKDQDDGAWYYKRGNFRTLRNLVYRAALIANADDLKVIRREHVNLAIQHGRLVVAEFQTKAQDRRMRESFSSALREVGVEPPQAFVHARMRFLTERFGKQVAYGFLRCALLMRESDPEAAKKRHGFYRFEEIETALCGGMSLNAWLNTYLKPSHVRDAAIEYFGLSPEDCGTTITETVKAVRRIAHKGEGEQSESVI